MDRLVFTSHAAIAEGAIARQAMVNEMANVSTVGFKRSFDVAMRSLKVEGAGFDTRYQVEAISRDVIDLTPGAMMNTGRPMDIAMQDATVMGVQAPNGQLAFTRRGDLRLNAQGALEDGLGHLVPGRLVRGAGQRASGCRSTATAACMPTTRPRPTRRACWWARSCCATPARPT